MSVEKQLTAILLLLLIVFGVLNALGIQPGEDRNTWLLYLFVFAWPAVSVAVLVAAVRALRPRRQAAAVALVTSVVSILGFIAWGRLYAGLW